MRRYLPAALGASAALAFLFGFWELAEDLATSSVLNAFDLSISAAIQSLRDPALTVVMRTITFLGDTPAVALATALLVFVLLHQGRRRQAIFSAVAVLTGGLLSFTLKDLFGRARPPVANALIALPNSFSFPSGHAIGSLCFAWVLAHAVITGGYSSKRKMIVTAIGIAYALLVGISRVYLGVHWPSDVLASWFLGGAMIALVSGVYQTIRQAKPSAN